MSIRLRLTLLYSAILALTLIVFGIVLYSIQAQDTLNSLKRDISLSSQKLVDATLRTETAPPPDETSHEPPPPKPFDEFSSDQTFQTLPERQIARVLDENGNLVAVPFAVRKTHSRSALKDWLPCKTSMTGGKLPPSLAR